MELRIISILCKIWDYAYRCLPLFTALSLLGICGLLLWDWRRLVEGEPEDLYLLFTTPFMILLAIIALAAGYPSIFGWVFTIGGEAYMDATVVKTRTNSLILFLAMMALLALLGVILQLLTREEGINYFALAILLTGACPAIYPLLQLYKRPPGRKLDSFFLSGSELHVNNKRLIPGTGFFITYINRIGILKTALWGRWEVYDHRTGETTTERAHVYLKPFLLASLPLSEVRQRLIDNDLLDNNLPLKGS